MAKEKILYKVYAPHPNRHPSFQSMVHKTDSLEDAKKHAEKVRDSLPDTHAMNVHVYGKGRKHFVDTKTKKWTSLKEEAPTNCMGMSSSTSGPITTYDPLLKRKKRGKLEPLSVFSRKKKEESGGSN